jgi:predicted DNA-binding transcriptional regulator YafY
MDLTDRIYELHRILRAARNAVSRAELQERLECSRATVARVIGQLRTYFNAPIEYDRRTGGYRYVASADGPWEMPGLWFNASELHALLAAQQLLARVQPGLLKSDLEPLRERIERILEARGVPAGDPGRRVRILAMGARRVEAEPFRAVAGAVLWRRRLRIVYHGRARDSVSERVVSPQRLTHYRENWYLDAWDHGRRALRIFSVDRIRKARALGQAAREIPDGDLDAHLAAAYGIFAGRPTHTAVLRFAPDAARWVADEIWHPEQVSRLEADGSYVLEIPYADSRELVRDVLKHGADVVVLSPKELREQVEGRLREALAPYQGRR